MASHSPFKMCMYNFETEHFPRVAYFKSRLECFLPRMERVLRFEFSAPNRGMKRLRSYEIELKELKQQKNRQLTVYAMSTVSDISDMFMATDFVMYTKNVKEATCRRSSTEWSHGTFNESVTLIISTPRELENSVAVLAEADWVQHAVLVVLIDANNNTDELIKIVNRSKRIDIENQVVYIKTFQRKEESRRQPSPNSNKELSSRSIDESTDSAFNKRGDSLSQPISRSCRSRRRSQRERLESPIRDLSLSPRGQKSAQALSPPSSPTKTRAPPSYERSHDTKRTKVSHNHFSNVFQKPSGEIKVEHMETDSSQNEIDTVGNVRASQTSGKTEKRSEQQTDLDTGKLKQAVSFQFERMMVDIIQRSLKLMRTVRDSRDKTAEVEPVTTLDKLIYEAEGLLGQSVTDSGVKMKEHIEAQRLCPSLADDILSLDGVYACGTLFDRLCIHIDPVKEEQKEKIKEEIENVTRRYQYTKVYDVQVVRSKPETLERVIICSA